MAIGCNLHVGKQNVDVYSRATAYLNDDDNHDDPGDDDDEHNDTFHKIHKDYVITIVNLFYGNV